MTKPNPICICGKEMIKEEEQSFEVEDGDMSSVMTTKKGHKCECGIWISDAFAVFNNKTYPKWKYSSDDLKKIMDESNINKKEPIRRNNMDTDKPKLTIKILQGVEWVHQGGIAMSCPYNGRFCTSKCPFYSTKSTATFKVVKCRNFVMGYVNIPTT